MYKHCEEDNQYLSLHDCHATEMLYDEGVLTFIFQDGIWITKEHSYNEIGKIVRTDKAEVKFYLDSGDEDDITIYVFDKKLKKTYRQELQLIELIELLNRGNHTLEFLYQYKGYNSMIVECCLWSKKKPYHRECEIKLLLKATKYCWNNLCEDREW